MKKIALGLILFVYTIIFSAVLHIYSLPGAMVFVDDRYILTLETEYATVNLIEGKHFIKITKFGYKSFEKSIEIKASEEMKLYAKLIPLAKLQIITNVETFTVEVENMIFNLKNGDIIEIPSNVTSITISSSQTITKKVEIKLTPFILNKINVKLERYGLLVVNTNPPKADVYMDGKLIGKSPLKFYPGFGKHKILVKKEGFIDSEKIVNISSNATQITLNFELIRGISVLIKTDPEGALLVINGKKYGRTPITVFLKEGKYNFSFLKTGYRIVNKVIDINEQNTDIYVRLKGEILTAQFLNSKDALFYIDGKYANRGIDKLTFDSVDHIVEIYQKTVTGESKLYRLILKPEENNLKIDPENTAVIELFSTKNSDLVYVNGKYYFTPTTLVINYKKIKYAEVFYLNHKRNLKLEKGKTLTVILDPVKGFDFEKGVASIFTGVPGAKVYIDGEFIGFSPIIGKVLKEGIYEVLVKYPDGSKILSNIEVEKGKHKVFSISKPYTFPVKISGPKDSYVVIDSNIKGVIPFTTQLNYGYHFVEFYTKNVKVDEFHIFVPESGLYLDLAERMK